MANMTNTGELSTTVSSRVSVGRNAKLKVILKIEGCEYGLDSYEALAVAEMLVHYALEAQRAKRDQV